MADALHPASVPRPLFPLPGFMPDAVPSATRLALAMVLAYGVSFTIQLDSASSAGVVYAPVRWLLIRVGAFRWTWNPPLAEASAFVCILGLLVALF